MTNFYLKLFFFVFGSVLKVMKTEATSVVYISAKGRGSIKILPHFIWADTQNLPKSLFQQVPKRRFILVSYFIFLLAAYFRIDIVHFSQFGEGFLELFCLIF